MSDPVPPDASPPIKTEVSFRKPAAMAAFMIIEVAASAVAAAASAIKSLGDERSSVHLQAHVAEMRALRDEVFRADQSLILHAPSNAMQPFTPRMV
jgi:hypothetical protein